MSSHGSRENGERRGKPPKSCIFCRRSHVVCSGERPCALCIKRDIAHLCSTEEPRSTGAGAGAAGTIAGETASNLLIPQSFVSQNVGSEFSSLNEFLSILEDPMTDVPMSDALPGDTDATITSPPAPAAMPVTAPTEEQQHAAAAREQFFLTAADPSIEMTPEDRLKLVINAKLEAGLLKPYDYAAGYTRLQEYMDGHMSGPSRQRILKPLSSIRPAFRSIARSLKDVDLVLVEESFERMLLGYDRVFTSMSMPACLWRRTGEIYRANKEFARLVHCTVDELREGRHAIYELMSEESAVNFWEKYGSIAFDKGQKAVLTSCKLRAVRDNGEGTHCCFSFTIRRDRYNIPVCIVGNFIPIPR
ncbi:gluconeogenesis transcription factor RDS2 KNAG_0J01530 [Huiozyma naganishii CBS 8797]|uniref:Zn(2)-C6 fungal-type domain-containing protein n=1 Tax=Huiozyma naganishii (strain ATCC MYA-139 / BCRC 22969 / CBS 8797 / KCTC 17520 / NBRC 10181 / NCYC 3082 / Yp74L-3) TaxID=1071383 RepID=J7S9Q2_HUIN7|nr:hypothetical protein KNAG_0J01530 [Kazachstania naganishii CBS 8797]CCK72234.1 hypothetical protein KNAG_0J01530 [Kazachstania naganishii CBS 8797]